MPTPLHDRLRDVIAALVHAIGEYAEREERPRRVPVAGPPASAAAIAALEARVGRPLPPSYRALLELHDGFKNLAFPFDLLALSDRREDATVMRAMPERVVGRSHVVESRRLVTQFDRAGDVEAVIIAGDWQPNHWVYLDPRATTADGEWTVVRYEPADDDKSFRDVVAFLASCLEDARRA